MAQWNCEGVNSGPATMNHPRSGLSAGFESIKSRVSEIDSEVWFGYTVGVGAFPKSLDTYGFPTNQPLATDWLYGRRFADAATGPIEARIAALGAKRFTLVGYGYG